MMPAFPRVQEDEWLDEDLGTPREVASALRSLRWVNRLFGGNRLHHRLLRRASAHLPKGSDLHLMEVASGRGDVLAAAVSRLGWPKSHLRLTLLDRSAQHLPSTTDHTWPAHLPLPERITADALAMPLPDRSVDIVSNCLFLHHLDEEQAERYLREALRVARVAVVVNDLERNWLHYRLARLMSLVDPSRLSKHDGPVSVRRAYTLPEVAKLAVATGHRFDLFRGYLFRYGLILWK
jgi:ubiquinone/menaquinone biosynthesis C-methylase UbiE